jgi:integrase
MSGHIRQRGKNWEIRWRVGGRVCTKTVKGGKKDAQRALRAALTAVGELVGERIAVWDVSARTRENYEQMGRLIARHIGTLSVQRLTTRDLERWHNQMRSAGIAPSTIRQANSLLGRSLADGVRHGLVSRNVARDQRAPRAPTSTIPVLPLEQARGMLEAFEGTELHTPLLVILLTGIRRAECLGLQMG